ncbi:two-component system chemotaxis sensor kinase CheA [Paenibacillus phyllosphaerae]|uniref:Chemotaxis protein CheA n=1 Tax=Paenibacillus phyllosphaerae TaxID=274593 RepID=A0A7W5AVK9_9BACL|nr:chemotaxis protein CheA [Paenibacillus phyllosphaerae]MBB3109412.1 two-component system chemotaxis sensor kinase CheA [Paenibacillus phyllosphaerae]
MDMNAYLSMFIDESNDHLQALNENLLRLESDPEDVSIVQIIFRSAHTLKGMSATMGFEDLAALTHEMENVLDLVRNNKLKMDSFIFDTLFKSLDALENMVQDVIAGGSGKADVTHIVTALKSIVSGDYKNQASAPVAAAAAVEVSGETPQVSDAASEAASLLDEFQTSVLMQSMDSGLSVYHVVVHVSEGCILKAARAYMVFDFLERTGEIVKSHPSVQDIEQEKFDRSFTVFMISSASAEDIHKGIVSVSEIESADVTQMDRETLAQLGRRAEQAAEQPAAPPAAAAVVNAAPVAAVPAKQEPAKEEKARPASNGPVARTIRVDIERLDALMNLFSELLIDRVRLEQLATEIRRSDLTETVEHMARVSGDLQNIVLKLRMVPVESVFNRFPRMVRDIAKSLDKKIDLVITGAETELDRTVIDEIGDPLVHLLRNSCDHGIESIAARVAAGKPEQGTVHLRAFHSGNNVFIEIEDDGNGINREKVKQIAIKNGVVTPEEAKRLTDNEINMLIFAPGFSTADKISDLSGRGVGLDVVKSKIASLGGHVSVTSQEGKGSIFSIQLPLTLSIISAMLIKLGTEKYAIPLSSIVETGIIRKEQIRSVHKSFMMEFRGSVIPVLSLSKVLDCPSFSEAGEAETEIVVIRKGEKLGAILVDEFIGQSDIVLKSLGNYLTNIDAISGATILGDGQVALIIDPNALIK